MNYKEKTFEIIRDIHAQGNLGKNLEKMLEIMETWMKEYVVPEAERHGPLEDINDFTFHVEGQLERPAERIRWDVLYERLKNLRDSGKH